MLRLSQIAKYNMGTVASQLLVVQQEEQVFSTVSNAKKFYIEEQEKLGQ